MKNSLAMAQMLERFPVARIFEEKQGVPLIAYPPTSQLRCTCRDCGMERVEPISLLIRDGRLGGLTTEDLAAELTCQRSSCGGNDFEIMVDLRGAD